MSSSRRPVRRAVLVLAAAIAALSVTATVAEPVAAAPSPPAGGAPVRAVTGPSAPLGVSVIAKSGSVDVSWSAPSSNGGAPVVAYVLQVSAGGPSVTLPASTTATSITGLGDGVARTLTIRAWNIYAPGTAVVTGIGASAPVARTPATTPSSGRYFDIARGLGGSVYLAALDQIEKVDSTGTRTVVVSGSFTGSVPENTLPNETPTQPRALTVASNGDLYWYDVLNNRIRRLSGGRVNSIAGTGTAGVSGDGLPATDAQVQAAALAVNPVDGAVLFADRSNHVVRRFTVGGTMTRVAGIVGVDGTSGDGGPALSAQLAQPADLAIDSSGGVYVAVAGGHAVRRFTVGGTISRVAGNGTSDAPQADEEIDALSANLPSPTAIDWSSDRGLLIDTYGMQRVLQGGKLRRFAGVSSDQSGTDADGTPATETVFARNDTIAGITYSGSTLYLATYGPTTDGFALQGKLRAAGPWKLEAPAAKSDPPIVAPLAKAGNESAQVWWVPSSDHRGAVTSYVVTASPGGATQIVVGTAHTATFDDLTPGTSYTFAVKAVDPEGTSAPSAPSNAVSPTAPPPSAFASWSAFVARQYADLVGRPPTSGESSPWVLQLTAGAKTAGDLDHALRRSAENTTNVDPVVRLYRAFLGRAPDAGGLRFWIKRRRTGTWSLTRIADSFATSTEFKTKYGTLTNRQFVTRIYTDVLGRTADTAGVNYWTGKLDRKERTRGGVMVGFSESSEYKRKQAENTDVAVAYVFLMGRGPTSAETSDWVSRQKAGTTHAALLTELLSSDGYAAHIGT